MSAPVSVSIRPMAEADLDQVSRIEQASYPVPWRREHFIQELHSPLSAPFVAVRDQEVVGYLCLMSLFEEAQVLNVAVAPEQRGNGIARMLLEVAVATARQRGAEVLVLEVRESNRVAIALYESFGFVRYFVRPGYYEGTEDAILMEKPLQ